MITTYFRLNLCLSSGVSPSSVKCRNPRNPHISLHERERKKERKKDRDRGYR